MTTTRTRTRFTTDSVGRVTIEYTDAFGDRVERTFTCPINGGYVIELFASGDTKQPCECLSYRGSTLRCESRDALPKLIRAEYRRMRAAERAA